VRRLRFLPIFAGILLLASSARADPASEADTLISRGLELREKKQDDEALALFRQAQQKSPSPRGRAQVALAEQALGMWVAAEADLIAALASESDPWITKNRAALDGALTVIKKHVGSLEVRGAERAEVYVDGRKLGSGAGPYRVEAGRRSLEVRAPGFQPTSRTFDLPAGGTARESVELVPAPAAVPVKPGEPPPKRTAEDPGKGQRILGWVFVGVGGALLATGGASLLVRKNYVDDYNASSCPGSGVAQPTQECRDQVDSSNTWMTVAIISLIAGGASAIGGGVILLTAPKSSTTVACGPFGCAGTF
jgi:hypothetical protein